MTAAAPRRCGADATDTVAPCRFDPVARVTADLPAGHPYGLPDRPTRLDAVVCGVHLGVLLAIVDDLGVDRRVERLPRA